MLSHHTLSLEYNTLVSSVIKQKLLNFPALIKAEVYVGTSIIITNAPF